MLRRSSAVLVWEVKRGLGVEAPEEGFDAMAIVVCGAGGCEYIL